jgi:16S rRNA processing protein RimM
MQDLVNIARISGTHHLKGAIKATSILEDVEVLNGAKVIVENSIGVQKLYTVLSAERINSKIIIMELEGIISVNEAKKLIECKIFLKREQLGDISEGEFYLVDIIDMEVITEDGEKIGKVSDVFTTAAHDIYVVQDGDNEIMIPAVDNFIKEVSFEKRIITVKLIEGMR